MTKYQINKDLPFDTLVEAESYGHVDGYFHFVKFVDGYDATVFSIKASRVETIAVVKD